MFSVLPRRFPRSLMPLLSLTLPRRPQPPPPPAGCRRTAPPSPHLCALLLHPLPISHSLCRAKGRPQLQGLLGLLSRVATVRSVLATDIPGLLRGCHGVLEALPQLVPQSSRIIGTGTFGCGTIFVEEKDFTDENVTFENSAPQRWYYYWKTRYRIMFLGRPWELFGRLAFAHNLVYT